jgi:hypothetical protein
MLLRPRPASSATAQLLAAATRSVQEAYNSLFCLTPVCVHGTPSSTPCSYSTSSALHTTTPAAQQRKRVPDGPSLADFIRSTGASAAAVSLDSSQGSLNVGAAGAGQERDQTAAVPSKRVFIETYGESNSD